MIRLTRRHFLSASAATAGAAWAGFLPKDALALPIRLDVVRRSLEVNGRPAMVFGTVQPDDTPGVTTEVGRRVHVILRNQISEPTLVHWHGLISPTDQDGVPGLSAPPIPPQGIAMYDVPLTKAGTNWMHSHVGLQEQLLLAAPLIVRDPAEAHLDEQEVVILLHDFTFRDPAEILLSSALVARMSPCQRRIPMRRLLGRWPMARWDMAPLASRRRWTVRGWGRAPAWRRRRRQERRTTQRWGMDRCLGGKPMLS